MSSLSHNKNSSTVLLVSLLGVGLLFWVLFLVKEVVLLVAASYLIAYVIHGPVTSLERRGVSRPVGTLLVLIGICLVGIALTLTAVPVLIREGLRLSTELPNYLAATQARLQLAWLELPGLLPTELAQRLTVILRPESLEGAIPSLTEYGPAILRQLAAGVFNTLLGGYSVAITILNLTVLPFFVFYLSSDLPNLHQRLLDIVPMVYRGRVKRIALEIHRAVSGFLKGQLLVATILFCLYAIGLGSIGIDLWFLTAFIAGFGNLIPYLGFLMGIVLASIMALVTFGDFAHLAMVWGVFGIVQLLEGFVISPRIIGGSVGLSPLVVFIALMVGGSLGGLVGLMLAVPLTAAARILGREGYRWLVTKI